MDGLSVKQFQGVHMKDISCVEELLTQNNLLYEIEIVDGNTIGELTRRNVQSYGITVQQPNLLLGKH